jgi:hypothetical protein
MTTAQPGHVHGNGYGVSEMNETCDRCGPAVRAAYCVQKCGELYLCRHCALRFWPVLSAQDWTIWPVNAHVLAPQACQYARADAGRDPGARA